METAVRLGRAVLPLLVAGAVVVADEARADAAMDARIEALVPELEGYIASGMKAFDDPGLAIGIVSGDRLVYAKGFGVRRKGGEPVGVHTVFQIGSTTKAFLAATLAIAVDKEKLAWDDRVVDLEPDFQLKDPWVTREFRVFDLLAQRSGLPPYANDMLGILGLDQSAMIRSLRDVEPVSSFRSTFAYTNITHLLAQRVVADAMGAEDWDALVRAEIFEPLAMGASSLTAEAIEAAPDHAVGHRWEPAGTVEVAFTPIFPYAFGGAGAINSTVEDLSRWVRLQLAGGEFEGKRIVSEAGLAATRIARVGIADTAAYAMGWVVQSTPNGRVVWHNGGTPSFGSYIGLLPDKDAGVIVLTNEENVGFPDAVGAWTLDRLLENPTVDYAAAKLEAAKANAAANDAAFAAPATPRPAPQLGALAGDYVNPSVGTVTVAEEGGALNVAIAGTGARLALKPWDGEVFTAELVPAGRFAPLVENTGPGPFGFVQFQAGADGKLARFRLFDHETGQPYDFERQ
jgi:CubicO group peptidase (beta-lactamase class C family)